MSQSAGKVYLVGAGPGDPGLLTLRGAQCLGAATVVLYDYLASPELLGHTRPGAELICLGRHGHGRVMSQAEINALMVDRAQGGASVVRLKGGDPMIFARAAEEITALEAAGVAYEMVPGVSAAQAASSYAAIPLTDRDSSSCVAFVTGHERNDKQTPRSLDYGALATFPGTLVFYMGVTTAPVWSHELIAHGKSADTPAAIIRRCSFADQETFTTTLGNLAEYIDERKLRPPAIIVVGEVARYERATNWFTARPLFGRTVLVTRPEPQGDPLADQLRALGANVLRQPAIEIKEPYDWSPVDGVIDRLAEFDWLVFSSASGVKYFMQRLQTLELDARKLGAARLAAIGPGTAGALAEFQLRADLQPDEYRAEALAAELAPKVVGKRVFLARASRGREILAENLVEAGARVEQAVVYESRNVQSPNEEIVAALDAGRIDWTTVTSSAIARALVELFGESLCRTKLAAISPLTAGILDELGFPPSAVADVYTMAGLAGAILHAERP